jgi:DNA-binding transcriptional LysR family regulator
LIMPMKWYKLFHDNLFGGNMTNLDELRALVALAKFGNISEAAENLQTSRARMRRKLSALEERTGTKLLKRVDGTLVPTEPGASLIEGSTRLLNEASLLITHTREIATEPTGILRAALQPGFPYMMLMLGSEVMCTRYKNMQIELRVAENPLQLLPKEVDLVVMIDEDTHVPDCTRYEMAQLQYQLVATPAYFAQHGRPATIKDLASHRLMVWRPPNGECEFLHLRNGERMSIEPFMMSSDERHLAYMAHAHNGIAYLPMPPFPDPDFPDLEPIFTEEVGRQISVRMFLPNALLNVPRVKAILEIVEMIRGGSLPEIDE